MLRIDDLRAPPRNRLEKLKGDHPGEILREEFLLPRGMTASALAIALRVPAPRINDIVRERRAVTAETALRLARHFGNSAEIRLGLQADFDLKTTAAESGARIERDVAPMGRAA